MQGRTIHDGDGVTAVVRANAVYIRLPRAESDQQYSEIFQALQHVFNQGFNEIDWIVDVSALSQLPLALLSVFTSFREELESKQHRLLLAGLRPEAFPASANADGPLFSQQRLMSLAR